MATLWRLIGLVVDGPLTLAALELRDAAGARVDAASILTSTVPPASGDLTALADGVDTTTCTFTAADVVMPSFALQWALPVDVEVTQLRVVGNLFAGTVQHWDGARWITAWRWASGRPVDQTYPRVTALWTLDGTPLDSDVSGLTLDTVTGNYRWGPGRPPYLQSAHFMGYSPGNSTRAYVQRGAGITAFGTGDFEIALWVYLDADGSHSYGRLLESKLYGSLGGWNLVRVDTLNPPRVRFHLSDGFTLLEAGMSNLTWHYVEVRRRAGLLGLLIDGVLLGTVASNQDFTAPDLAIGGNLSGDERLSAYINEVRIIKGWSRPVESYVLPSDTAPRWEQPSRVSVMASAPVVAATAGLGDHEVTTSAAALAGDVEHGGGGRIWGTTNSKGPSENVPTKARVVLLHQRSKVVVRETWSDSVTGVFSFPGIDTRQEFIALAEDAGGNFRPVAANRLVPEVQP